MFVSLIWTRVSKTIFRLMYLVLYLCVQMTSSSPNVLLFSSCLNIFGQRAFRLLFALVVLAWFVKPIMICLGTWLQWSQHFCTLVQSKITLDRLEVYTSAQSKVIFFFPINPHGSGSLNFCPVQGYFSLNNPHLSGSLYFQTGAGYFSKFNLGLGGSINFQTGAGLSGKINLGLGGSINFQTGAGFIF